jgi:hypothetical protein
MPGRVVGVLNGDDEIRGPMANLSDQGLERLLEDSGGQMHDARCSADERCCQAERIVQLCQAGLLDASDPEFGLGSTATIARLARQARIEVALCR